jgi:DNA-binding MarR family transcriptional regulator
MARPGYERGTGFLLSRLGTLVERAWRSVLEDHGLTQIEYAVIAVLKAHGALGQARLAELIAVDGRNLVPIVAGLARRRLIEREGDPSDGRRRFIALSEQGRDVSARVGRAAGASETRFLSGLQPEERDALNALLRRVYDGHTGAPEDRTANN